VNLILTRLETQVNSLVNLISSYSGKESGKDEDTPSKEA